MVGPPGRHDRAEEFARPAPGAVAAEGGAGGAVAAEGGAGAASNPIVHKRQREYAIAVTVEGA